MKINSNIQALIANSVLKSNESKNAASTEKLSSGYKLNHASDSPSGMAISNKMNAQIRSLNKAKDNTSNAINVVQTADGALAEVHSMLQRMNELAVKASSETLTSSDRDAIQTEVNALKKEIDRVASDTEYNTQNLLGGEQEMKGYTNNKELKVLNYDTDFPAGDYKISIANATSPEGSADPSATIKYVENGTEKEISNLKNVKITKDYDENGSCLGGKVTATLKDGSEINFSYSEDYDGSTVEVDVTGIGGMKVQVGSSSGKEIQVVIPNMDTENIGIDNVDMSTPEGAKQALDSIADAIDYVSKSRSSIGAYQNRLESTETSLEENIENLTEAYSTIKDVDMAEEMVNYTTLQVLVQAGTSMLTQANEQPQQALQLLQ